MAKCTTQNRTSQFTSRTRPSIRNSRRYLRTSGTDGESGEPRLSKSMPFTKWNVEVTEFLDLRRVTGLMDRSIAEIEWHIDRRGDPLHCSRTQSNRSGKRRRGNGRQRTG